MEFENLLKLIDTVSKSGLDSFCYEDEKTKIKLGKKQKNLICAENGSVNGLPAAAVSVSCMTETSNDITAAGIAEKTEENGHIIKSPLVGIFYAAPSEDADPYVSVGDTVKKGQTLSIIEAMKLMNEIESDFDGTVKEIFVKNGEAVEYGQPLFCIG